MTGTGETLNSLQDGLVGHWTFDEEGGDVALDASGHGNDGVLINAGRGQGAFRGTLELGGGGDSHVSVPGSPSLNRVEAQVTVAARVFPRTLRQGFTVVVSRQTGTLLHPDQFFLGFGPEQGVLHYKWHLGVENGGEGDCYEGVPEPGQWVHMAGTYDGTTMRLFVDGHEIGSRPLTGRIRLDDNPVTLGGEENGPTPRDVENELDGYLDDVRLYDRALSPDEIWALAQMADA